MFFVLCSRGLAGEWSEALHIHLRTSKAVRTWFAFNVIFKNPGILTEYLLECPSTEVSSFCWECYLVQSVDCYFVCIVEKKQQVLDCFVSHVLLTRDYLLLN